MIGKCLAVSWDDKYRVVGAVAERNRNAEKPVLTGLCHATSDHTFSEQLAEVYNQLMSPEIEAVILGGHIEDAVCFDLSMPKLPSHELKNALEFELPRQLPCTTDNLTVFHRRIGGKDDAALSRMMVEMERMTPRLYWKNLTLNPDNINKPKYLLFSATIKVVAVTAPDLSEQFWKTAKEKP